MDAGLSNKIEDLLAEQCAVFVRVEARKLGIS